MEEKIEISRALSQLTKPEHAVLLISGSSLNNANIMVAGWVMRTSHEPSLIAVSVGKTRYTHGLMEENNQFVLAYPVKGMEEIIEFCGSRSGRDVNKFEKLGIKTVPARKIDLPIIENARVNFECRIIDRIETGDHTVFVGEVLAAGGNPGKSPLINVGDYVYKEFNNE
ncbi:flavin reductase family protein [Elusimicrobiota bacterium]